MNWLFPGFLAGGFLIGLPILLHFLRSKPKTVVRFPSLRFLGETAIRDTRRHRLRRWLTLALRTLVIALLAAAFARPFFKNAAAARGSVMVIAVDNSMSMQATGRWEAARQWALSQLDALQPGDTAGLLLMNPTPSWALPLTDDLARVRATLSSLPPGFETTRYAGTVRMAGDALTAHPAHTKTLVWMADEQRLGWLGRAFDNPLPPGVQIRLADVMPAPARQAAITSLRWSPGPTGEPGVEATVRLFTPEKDTRHLVVSLPGDRPVSAPKVVALETGTDSRVRLPLDLLPPGTALDGVRVAMTESDDLASDNVAYLAAAPRQATAVLCSAPTSGTNFLAHALDSTRKLPNETPLKAIPLPNTEWPAGAVAVLNGPEAFQPPQLARLEKFAAAGGALWMFVDGSAAQSAWLQKRGIKVDPCPDEGKPWHLQDWDSEHPSLAAFSDGGLLPLMDVAFEQGFRLDGENLTPVANWSNGTAAIAEWSANGQRVFLCGFPLERAATDWPLRPSFVPFVHQSVRWLASLTSNRRDWRVGDTIPLPHGPGTWHAVDAARPQPDRKVNGGIQPTVPGLYAFEQDGNTQFFAVNPPVDESDLAPWPDPAKFAGLESKATPAPTSDSTHLASLNLSDEVAESRQRIWWWLLAICGVGILAELALANRTAP